MYKIYELHNTIKRKSFKGFVALWFNVRSNPKSDAQVWRSDERQSCGQVKARHCNA